MTREKITLELMLDCIKDIDNIIKIDYPNDYKIFTIPLREYVKQQETQSKRLTKVEGLLELYKRLFNVCKEYKHTSIGLSDDSEFLNVMSELEEKPHGKRVGSVKKN